MADEDAMYEDEMTALLGHEVGLATQQPHRVSLGLASVLTESLRSNSSNNGNNISGCLPANSSTQREGCVMCRTRTRVVDFTDLDPGDHILMRGQMCCLGCFYDHHAIVTDIQRCEDSDNCADIYVVDVPSKGLEFVGCAYEGITRDSCCSRVYFPCCRCRFPVEEHKLLDRTWYKADLRAQHVCRIDYHLRQNDKNTTRNIARQFCRIANDDDLEYNLLLKNCEHFTNACVNGPETPNLRCIEETISTQSHHCCWQIFLFIRWLFLVFFFAFDFYLYAVVQPNKNIDLYMDVPWTNSSRSLSHGFFKTHCNNINCVAGRFGTTCYYTAVLLFLLLFDIIYIFGLCAYYQPLYKRGFICQQCLRMVRLDGITRIHALAFIDALSLYLEDPLYRFYLRIEPFGTTLVFVSLLGAALLDSVSSVITWVLGMGCFPTCRGACQFSKNFRFRCCARPVACCVRGLVRCFCGIKRCARNIRRGVANGAEERNAINV